MAKRKTAVKKSAVKSAKSKPAKISEPKKSQKGKIEGLTNKLNSLKKSRSFPFLMILLVLISVIYLVRGLLVAAVVGGKPISRIKLVNMLEKQSGQEALDNLITLELVSQEAKRRDINITDTEVSSEILRIEEVVQAQGTTLDAALSVQGQTRKDLEENIRIQKTVEKLLAESIKISDEDVKIYFEKNKTSFGTEVAFEEVRDSIRDQMTQEKLSSEFQILLQKLKAEGNIIYFVDFE